MVKEKILFATLFVILFVGACNRIIIINNNENIDFSKYDNVQNIYFEYGQYMDSKKYEYNLKAEVAKEIEICHSCDDDNEIFIDEETGDQYCFNYYMSENSIKVNNGIRHINLKHSIDELLWSSSYLTKKYNKKKVSLQKLTFDSINGQLYFYFNIDGSPILGKVSVDGCFNEIVKYKSIKHLLWSYNDYLLIDNKIFVIDRDSYICFYDILNEKLINTNCKAYNFILSNDKSIIYFIDLDNNICTYDIKSNTQKILLKLKCERVEWIDIDECNNFILLVESLDKSNCFGPDTSQNFKQNELNLYEISTGKKMNIKKASLFNIVFEAHFID